MPEMANGSTVARVPLVVGGVSRVDGAAIWTAGVAVGWLTGLSVSPVLATVLASVLGILAGAVTSIRSPRRSREKRDILIHLPLAVPVGLLMTGIAAGAPLGIVARTHRWFEPPPQQIRTVAAQTTTNPVPTNTSSKTDRPAQDQGVLFGIDEQECTELVLLARSDTNRLRADLRKSTNPQLRAIERRIHDSNELARMVNAICTQSPQ